MVSGYWCVLFQEWTDDALQWDPESYGGVQSIRMRPDMIWMPDIDLYNRLVICFVFKYYALYLLKKSINIPKRLYYNYLIWDSN